MTQLTARKVLIGIGLSTIAVLIPIRAQAEFRDAVLADNPFLYYEFEETSGTTAVDSATGDGNADNGMYRELAAGGITLGISGPVGLGVELDGDIGASVRVAAGTTGVTTGTWSIEMILRTDAVSDDCCTSIISTSGYPDAGGTAGGAVHFNFEDDGNLILIDAPSSGETGHEFPALGAGFLHIVATSDNVTGLARRVYVNGSEIAQTEGDVPLLGAGGLSSFDGLLDIGSLTDGRFLTGVYDEFAIYNTVLSQARVFEHFLQSGLAPPALLTINRDTGSVVLKNISGGALTIDSYEIHSDAGTLDPAEWDSIAPADGFAITSQTEFELAENDSDNPASLLTLANDATVELASGGNGLWRRFFDQDVEFSGIDGSGNPFDSVVVYTGARALFGDLDLDNDIDIADYQRFQNGFGQDVAGLSFYEAYFRADLNGDETHNFQDFIEFATAFDAANGAGAFQAMRAAVPEPSKSMLVAAGLIGLLLVRRRIPAGSLSRLLILAVSLVVFSASTASAAGLVEYLFNTNFNDTSGNSRHGMPDPGIGNPPTVSAGKLQLTGDLLSGLKVPLGAANPFGGVSDYTVEMRFSTTGNAGDPNAGVILFSSADATDPTSPENESLAIFVERILDDDDMPTGQLDLVVDYFFVGEVRVEDAGPLFDGSEHSIKIVYRAPEDPGDVDDPNPGMVFINVDNEWRTFGELAPRPPTTAMHDVRIGGTLNTDFPLGDALELQGTADNFRVFNDADMAPDLLRIEVDLGTGEIDLLGGDFDHELRYYEINSDAGALNPAGWNSLEEQAIDAGMGDVHWDELNGSAAQLAEGFLLGDSLFDATRAVSLGNAFALGGARDLEFIALTADLDLIPTEVIYVNAPAAVAGDFNQNGVVDAADYVVWRNSVGAGSLPNEGGISPGVVDTADYDFWRSRFGATSGTGSGGAVASVAVPEPAMAGLPIAAAYILGCFRRTSN